MTKRIDEIHNYAYQMMMGDQTGHGFDHVQRVVNNAKYLLQNETANADVVLTTAYLHDVFDDKLTDQPAERKLATRQFLLKLGYATAEIGEILYIIDHMSFSANLEQHYDLSMEGQIVQDADRLDALGALGIARLFSFGGVHQYPMYDPTETQVSHTKAEYRKPRATINHYEVRMNEVIKRFNTETGKRVAQHRFEVAKEFVERFKAEWENQEI
ncbi:HD domain-containing protein [Fructilactobacillus frigidiflavus]|uniref:HD domain-containing protein n=1 Tax=Fructilactobacillus frigidiflavus TaxID=3242688 RepID=UPI0037579578